MAQVEQEHERLDLLVNDIFGGDRYAQWDKNLWAHDLAGGLRMLRMGVDTHLITSAKAPHFCVSESPSYVARGVAALGADPDARRYAGRVLSSAELARTHGVTDIDSSQPDCWCYLVEIHDASRSAEEFGHR